MAIKYPNKYEQRNGQAAPESRARNPKEVKGIRTKFRTAIRGAGITGKFSTDFYRRPKLHLIVLAKDEKTYNLIKEQFSSFENYEVKVYKKY